jgi:transketolase
MLQYALLHLTGYDLSIEEIKNFRQLHSKTPGHPEVGVTPGVETTTGPLGQGLANSVGLALAEKLLAAEFNQAGAAIVDHHTYVFLGDGCLMEGVSHEACALAGTWKLGKLIALYDDNGISIDGEVKGWFTDDSAERFRAYGWQVIGPIDGHDVDAVDRAIAEAKQNTDQPSFILCRTVIGKGAPTRAGTAKAHGEALGTDELTATRNALDWPYAPFEIPADIYADWDARPRGKVLEAEWTKRFEALKSANAGLAAEFSRRLAGELPANFADIAAKLIAEANAKAETVASRKASQYAIEALAPAVPEMLGGSADLTHSNLTLWKGAKTLEPDHTGRYISYGVREFGMAAIMNGIALHGGYIPFGGTFLTFSDYSRNAIRMAALMKQRVIHVFTHDSIGLGEDGPTHQAVEHAASLRLIPNLDVWRPGDAAETAIAWTEALLAADRPSALLLSRQNLPAQERSDEQVQGIRRGAYVLSDRTDAAAVILATGSELSLAMDAQKLLDARGVAVRVVSVPSSTVFDRQDRRYRNSVLGHDVPRIGVEAGVTRWWGQYGCTAALGVDSFGESAPGPQVYEHFGLTAARLANLVQEQADLERRHVLSSN